MLPRTPSLNLYRQLECILSGKIDEDRALEATCSKKYWNCVPQESSCMEVGTHPLTETNLCLVEKMMPRYRDRYGFGNIPSWHLITARVENRKVKPLNLNHDPTLIIKSPSLCGWDTISKASQGTL